MKNELESFNDLWERETAKTIKLLESLPRDGYDFRPDPEGRSLGEPAWHLAEIEGYGSFGIERARAAPPRTVEELRPGFERIHHDAVERVKKLRPEELDRSITYFSGQPIAIRNVLWDFMLLHGIHHRGQLELLCRQSGGRPASMFGPAREAMPLRRPT